jgi:Zn-dependent peptidase ImmA (M78 family)
MDLAASWGGIQLWVDGVNVSAHVDGGQTVDAAYWYLLPLLEWLASGWDPLLHEQRLPDPESPDAAGVSRPWLDLVDTDGMSFHRLEHDWAWRSRHSLRSAREGGILPGVFVRRHRDLIEISWQDRPITGAEEVTYVAPQGRGLVDPALVASSVHEVLLEAATYLVSVLPDSSRVRRLVEQVQDLRQPSVSDVRVAWLAGLGVDVEEALQRWKKLRDLATTRWGERAHALFSSDGKNSELVCIGSPVAALLFGSVSPAIGDTDALSLTELALDRPSIVSDELAALTRHVSLRTLAPAWEQGYDLAAEARDELDVGDDAVEMDALLDSLGVTVSEIALRDSGIRAVSLAGGGRAPSIAVNRAYPHAELPPVRQFTLAHELCHILFDEDYGVDVAIASGPWAPEGLERRANAFAAMFLMPLQLLRSTERGLGVSLETRGGLAAVADALLVSQRALLEHGRNVGLIGVDTRDRLLNESTQPKDGGLADRTVDGQM